MVTSYIQAVSQLSIHLFLLAISCLAVQFAVVQLGFPVDRLQVTRGIVIEDSTPYSSTSQNEPGCYQARFVSQDGTIITIYFNDTSQMFIPGDVIPITYFPWDPSKAQYG